MLACLRPRLLRALVSSAPRRGGEGDDASPGNVVALDDWSRNDDVASALQALFTTRAASRTAGTIALGIIGEARRSNPAAPLLVIVPTLVRVFAPDAINKITLESNSKLLNRPAAAVVRLAFGQHDALRAHCWQPQPIAFPFLALKRFRVLASGPLCPPRRPQAEFGYVLKSLDADFTAVLKHIRSKDPGLFDTLGKKLLAVLVRTNGHSASVTGRSAVWARGVWLCWAAAGAMLRISSLACLSLVAGGRDGAHPLQ